MVDKIKVKIILPCHNEEDVIENTIYSLENCFKDINKKVNISYLIVDDGSTDKSWEKIIKLVNNSSNIDGIKLSTNFGHQIAILAGLEQTYNLCDYLITMDADLQHPPEIAKKMIKSVLDEPLDLINAQQKLDNAKNINFLKRITSIAFYKLLNLMGVKIDERVGDFRLMSSKVAKAMILHKDLEFFPRGIVSRIGFKQKLMGYSVGKRIAGRSKYTIKKMINFSLQGITSTSIIPLRTTFLASILIFLICFLLLIFSLISFIYGEVVPGWSSIIISIYFLFGLNFLVLAMLGEYLGKTYRQVLNRPRYIVEKTTLSLKD